MCEQMGWEPKEEDLPQDGSNLSLECQQALTVLQALPDIWEGMKLMIDVEYLSYLNTLSLY